MSGVFQNIDPSPPGECVPPPLVRGRTHSLGGEGGGGGGSIFWKTPDTPLYFTYVSALCYTVSSQLEWKVWVTDDQPLHCIKG
jgi:hypothetical protein